VNSRIAAHLICLAASASAWQAMPARAEDAALSGETAAACAREADDAARLACYDRHFGKPARAPASTQEAPAAPAGRASATAAAPAPTMPAPDALSAEAAGAVPPAEEATGSVASVLSKTWELHPDDKRGTFIVRTYLPNYFLPLHASSSIGTPSSPTHPASTEVHHYRRVEAKLQLSLRTKLAEDVLLPGADLWFAYTQRSLWQLWTPSESSPFRSTDYQPEAIFVVPVPEDLSALPLGWHWRMAQLGAVHQSNGQSDPLSRSWNRVYLGAAVERGELGLQLKAYKRLPESGEDDNPDISRYVGRQEIVASWLPGRATASLTWRTSLASPGRGSLQFDWTYPVRSRQVLGLRWYLQLFSGYGETLLDYNHRQTSIGLGLSLFQF
jgi:phospholipase A1